MGLMDKFKNLFTEEVEEEEEKKPVKAVKSQVEITSPKVTRSEKHTEKIKEEKKDVLPQDDFMMEDTFEKKEEEYKFPFFDDTDFETIEQKQEKKEKKKSSYRKDAYNPPKEEKKVFKPTPIISPVYGILDKNYQKEDIVPRTSASSSKEDMVDVVRNKAYGTLNDDIETTLFGKNRVLFDEEENQEDVKEDFEHVLLDEKPRHEEKLHEGNEPTNEPTPISDEELFSMIDSMYDKGDK